MVRLRRVDDALPVAVELFTIHYGEIKTVAVISHFIANIIFTIHYGEIKTLLKRIRNCIAFYLQSTMVRLRRFTISSLRPRTQYLQSTMVRLRRC